MLKEAALCALGGFMAKACDEQADNGLPHAPIPFYGAAILYGAGLGFLTATTPLSSLFLALAVAAVLAGKIDHPLHIIGLAAFALVVAYLPMSSFDPWLFSLFLAGGLLDELNLRFGKIVMMLGEQRLFTPLAALLAMLAGGQYLFLAGILAFDLAYRLAGWLMEQKMMKKMSRMQAGGPAAKKTPNKPISRKRR